MSTSQQQQFRPIGELAEAEENAYVIERRSPHWAGPACEAIDRAVDDGDTIYLVEDGRQVAVIKPLGD